MQNYLHFSSLFASLMSLWIALSVLLYRIGFSTSLVMLAKAVGLCFLIIFLPYRLVKEPKHWWQNRSLQSLLILFALGVLGYFVRFVPIISYLGYPIALFGLILFFVALAQYAKSFTRKGITSLFLFSLVLGSYFLAYYYTKAFYSPIYEVVNACSPITQEILLDNFYHTAVAKMIQTYQVLSTGTEGVVSMDYNVVSHWLLAQLALLLGADIVAFYDLLNPIVFFPFFSYVFFAFLVELYKFFIDKFSFIPSAKLFSIAFWIVFLCLFFPIPDSIYARGLLGLHFVQSPTYTPALAFLFCLASACLVYYQNFSQKILFQWVAIPLLLLLIGYTHVAAGVAIVAAAGYVFLRFQLFRKWYNWLWGLLLVSILFYTYWLTAETNFSGKTQSYEGAFAWFYFFREKGFVWWDFLLGLYLPLLLLTVVWGKFINKISFIEKKTLFLELIAIIALAGIAPNCVLALFGSTGMYFMSIQRLLAGAVLLAFLPFVVSFWQIWKKKYAIYFATALVIGFGLIFYMSFRNIHNDAWKTNLNARKTLMQIPDFSWKANHFIEKVFSNDKDWEKAKKLFSPEIKQKLSQHEYIKFTRAIAQLDTLSIAEKRQSLLHIPFHQIRLSHLDMPIACMQMPFYLVSVSGIALLGGIPKASCPLGAYGFGYLDYTHRDKVWNEGLSRQEILQIAKARGIRFVYYFKPENYSFEKIVVD